MKKQLLKKTIAVLLTLIMVFSQFPISALANEGDQSPSFASLAFFSDTERTVSYKLEPEFSSDILEYTMDVPDYQDRIYAIGSASREGDYAKAETIAGGWGGGATVKAPLPATISGINKNNKLTLRVGPENNISADNGDTFYTVDLNRVLTLKGLEVNDTLTPGFNRDIFSYTAGVDADAESIDIKATGFSSGYSITIAGQEAVNGESASIDLNWDEHGRMQAPIVISNGTFNTTYNLTLIREDKSDTPVISVNPQSAVYNVNETTSPDALTVRATANGELAYQWYRNTDGSTTGDALIVGATGVSCVPEIPDELDGTTVYYYYCEVTNTGSGKTAVSDRAAITVMPDPTPVITIENADGSDLPGDCYEYDVDEPPVGLKVEASSKVDGGTFLYTWKQVWKDSSTTVSGPDENNVCLPYTNSDGEDVYFCTVTYILNGRRYTADSPMFPAVRVVATSAAAPYISQQPSGAVYQVGETEIAPLEALGFPEGSKPGTITHQWYSSTDGENYVPIDGAIDSSYTPPASDSPLTMYYKCRLTNTFTSISGITYTSTADSAVAIIKFINGFTEWEGKGTDTEPFLIKDAQDLEELREYVNMVGAGFEGYSFKMDADITLPDGWVPIGSLKGDSENATAGANIYPFSATFDGGGHTLTIPEGGKPLFGYVRVANIRNLQIYGKQIDGSALINNYTVDYGPTGSYGNTPAYTAKIENVTLKSGSKTLYSGLVNGNGSGMNHIFFCSCTVESGVTIGYEKDQSSIGSLISSLNGNMVNCVSYADVYGTDYVGGLIGKKGQSMGDCSIWDSAFHGTVNAAGEFVGGIIGGGYSDATAPNSPCVTIQNCYVTGDVTAADSVGGIFGGEGGVKECWENGIGYIQNNYFTAKLTATKADAVNVGGVIGFMKSLDRYNVISNNYYLDSCGAERGIGAVESVDKTTELYSRGDDPTGTDSDKLTSPVAAAALTDGTLLAKLNFGINSSGNWTAGGEYPALASARHVISITIDDILQHRLMSNDINDIYAKNITVHYNDGLTETVSAKDADIRGYDTSSKGFKTVTVTYKNHTYIFRLQVTAGGTNPGEDPTKTISVTFRLIGATLASEDVDIGRDVNDSKYITWIATRNYTMNQGDTVYDLFVKALDDAGLHAKGQDSNYVKTITAPDSLGGYKLSEFTNGQYSGWMYTVNGRHPGYGLCEQALSNGDRIIFHYVNDYRYEVKDWFNDPDYPALGDGSDWNKWLKAPDKNPDGSEISGDNPAVSPDSTVLTPKVTASNGTAAVKVNASDITGAIKNAKENSSKSIVISPKITGTAKKVSIELPKTSLSSIASETDAALTVETPVGKVTIPNDILASLAERAAGSTVTVSLESVGSSALTADQQKAVGDSPVYDISLLSGGKNISGFDGGSVTISLPYTLKNGEDPSGITVWYLNDAGGLEKMTCTYDEKTGLATFTTTHLSKYVVGYADMEVWKNPYTDVKPGDWYYNAVEYTVKNGLLNGTAAATFSPDANMTRAMLVTVLYRLEGSPSPAVSAAVPDDSSIVISSAPSAIPAVTEAVTGAANDFTDVKDGQWYTDAVVWANANGIVTGYGNGRFGTNDHVTREQTAAILYRYAQSKGYDVTKTTILHTYTDAPAVSGWAQTAMCWANAEGLITGRTANTIVPGGTATRAEAAAILMRFIENIAE